MHVDGLGSILNFIKSNQNLDGGWGYRIGSASLVEPTSFCILALLSGGEERLAGLGRDYLNTCLKAPGGIGTSPYDPNASWMAYAALLAYRALGETDQAKSLISWILGFKDGSDLLTSADIKITKRLYRFDPSISGWPWTVKTSAWVESTSLFLIALARAGVPLSNRRMVSGSSLLLDRRIPSGGWNFGNPYSKNFQMDATALSTSLALVALAATGHTEKEAAILSGIRFLQKSLLSRDQSVIALAWGLIALRSFSPRDTLVSTVGKYLNDLQQDDGSFRGNPFESALAYIALSDESLIISSPGIF